MKPIFNHALLWTAAVALTLAGCSKDNTQTPAGGGAKGEGVSVTLPVEFTEATPASAASAVAAAAPASAGAASAATMAEGFTVSVSQAAPATAEADTAPNAVASDTPATRTIGWELGNVWVLQFDSSGLNVATVNTGSLAAGAYLTASGLQVGTGCTLCVVANGPASGLSTSNPATLAAFETTMLHTAAATTDATKLPLSGRLDGVEIVDLGNGKGQIRVQEGVPARLMLKRIHAEVTLTVDFDVAGYTLSGVQLYNVPVGAAYAPSSASATFPDNSAAANFGYTTSGLAALTTTTSGTQTTYKWLVPENRRGEVYSVGSESGRNSAKAPAYATYARIEIEGYAHIYYDVYLGSGTLTNFDLERNHTYTQTATLKGSAAYHESLVGFDGRISCAVGIFLYDKPANCYVGYPINGKYLGIGFNALKKPRAKYTSGNSTPVNTVGANPSTGTGDNLLSDDIVYQAGDVLEVAWQTAVNHGTTGGAANMVIKSVALNSSGLATVEVNGPGNALLSYVRGGIILWNYHIWVTDTNPFVNFYATGGDVNGSTPSGQAQFMDRNLGALAATTSQPTAENAYKYFGVFYQHGRPTPFTGQGAGTVINTYTTIYDKAGTAITTGAIGGYINNSTLVSSVTEAIKNPTMYYHYNGIWYDLGTDISLWSDYGIKSKSIYDPCPYGYRVPINGSWTGMTTPNYGGASLNAGSAWSGTWWPVTGNRNTNSGLLTYVGNYDGYWASTRHSNARQSYYLSLNSNGASDMSSDTRSYGFAVRCVQEGY